MQLASFMGELQASGLLAEGQEPEAAPAPETQPSPSDEGISMKPDLASSADERPHPSEPAGPDDKPEDSEQQPPQQQLEGTEPAPAAEPQQAGLANAAGDEAAAADSEEQRVLGSLEGAPGWHEVIQVHSSAADCSPLAGRSELFFSSAATQPLQQLCILADLLDLTKACCPACQLQDLRKAAATCQHDDLHVTPTHSLGSTT